jgi:hypothetical protein
MLAKLRTSLSRKLAHLKLPSVTLALAVMSSFGFASIVTAQGLPTAVTNPCGPNTSQSTSANSLTITPSSDSGSIQL